ncbi:MAG: hypothetical protein ABIG55_04600, partial [Candidatus Omnitrophota bacterium]
MKTRTDGISYGKTAGGSCFPDDPLHSRNFIRLQTDHRRRIWLKLVSCFVAFTFLFQQVSYGMDFASLRPLPVAARVGSASLLEDIAREIEVTNYDLLSKKRNQGIAGGVFSPAREREQDAAYAPHYLKRQQAKHEEIMRQKQDTEDLMLMINNKHKQRFDEDLPLKKKQSAAPEGGIYFTLEDFGSDGSPRQLNRYIYEGGNVSGKMIEVIAYDISGLSSGEWQGQAEEITPKEGKPFVGSTSQIRNAEGLSEDRIISRTVYSGRKGKEEIQHVFSGYDETGKPSEITLYDYSQESQETRTYNISSLERATLEMDIQKHLTDDMLSRKTVYDGTIEDGKINYVVDTFMFSDDGENVPNRVSIYDYNADGDEDLDEVRTYGIENLHQEDWFDETLNAGRLQNITVYDGEKGEEKVDHILTSYFRQGDIYLPWERTDYVYEQDTKVLKTTRTYDISGLSEDERNEEGKGVLEEEAFLSGDEGYERKEYSYSSYGTDGLPQTRTDYEYDGKALKSAEVYDIVGTEPDSKELLLDRNVYEGRAGKELLKTATSYNPDGAVYKNTLYTYDRNSAGIDYVSFSEDLIYSEDGVLMEKVLVTNGLVYLRENGEEAEDKNANTRTQNIVTYSTYDGVEVLSKEEEVIYSDYTSLKQPGWEERMTYVYDEDGMKKGIEYREISNNEFNSRGSATEQTIVNYGINEYGEKAYQNTQEIKSEKTDYHGNVLDRIETVWTDPADRSEDSLLFKKITHSDYDNKTARMRGNSTYTEILRYDSLETSSDNEIDRTVVTADIFDPRGYITHQTADTYAVDNDGSEKISTKRETYNEDLDIRGNASTERVVLYQADKNGDFLFDDNGGMIESSYQVLTNRTFDSRGNVLNQMILTYSQGAEETRILLDSQEIRSMGFHSSGVALKQIIAIYGDKEREELIDVKTVENSNISSLGDVGISVATRYGTASIIDEGGRISYDDLLDRQVTESTQFDLRGNALTQTVIKTSYDEETGSFVFTEAQEITNDTFDFRSRIVASTVMNYSGEEMREEDFLDMQKIDYLSYDTFGNVLEQTIDTYLSKDAAVGSFVDRKHVVNDYTDPDTGIANHLAQRRGAPVENVVSRYDSPGEEQGSTVDVTVTRTEEFDATGRAVRQTTDTYVKDKLATRREIYNGDITLRGDSLYQEIITYTADESGAEASLEVSSFQVFTNRIFDSNSNVKSQTVLTYNKKDADSEGAPVLLDAQEIRSSGFHSSGVASKQIIATYSDELMAKFMDLKVIENGDISSMGNVGTST